MRLAAIDVTPPTPRHTPDTPLAVLLSSSRAPWGHRHPSRHRYLSFLPYYRATVVLHAMRFSRELRIAS